MEQETKAERERRLRLRDKYRSTVCSCCRYNYYNWPKPAQGADVPVAEDYSCWHLERVRRGKCPIKS